MFDYEPRVHELHAAACETRGIGKPEDCWRLYLIATHPDEEGRGALTACGLVDGRLSFDLQGTLDDSCATALRTLATRQFFWNPPP